MNNFDDYTNENKTAHKRIWPHNAEDPYKAKYQYLINKREGVGVDHFNDPKAFIEYSNDMHDVYKFINYYNSNKENKILTVFHDMIADMINNRRLDSIVTELFIRGRKENIFLVFITQSYFKVLKDVRQNTTHFFIAKILKKKTTSTNCNKSFIRY